MVKVSGYKLGSSRAFGTWASYFLSPGKDAMVIYFWKTLLDIIQLDINEQKGKKHVSDIINICKIFRIISKDYSWEWKQEYVI